ncbi:TPA: restriction endonuclease subunit S [Vibrio vulnificus]|nr:restriction endonuclease subunit S [Vibrio vulnificus]
MSIWIETKLKESEIGKIPLDWSCTTLNKIADINPKPIKLDSDDIEVSFVGMADVSESAKLMNTTNRLYGEVKKGFTSFQDNDVLVAKITPCFENGKGALVSNLTNGIGFGSTEFHVIRAKEQKGCPEFIHHITTTHNFRVKGEMNMTGTAGQKRVGKDFIASYLIACPPFVEQQKIAEVLSTVDKKIDLIDQKIAETEKLKTGLMQKLFSEGVGVQDENGEWQPHTEFQDSTIGEIPNNWKIKTLDEISEVNPKPYKTNNMEMEVSFVGMADISESAKIIRRSKKKYIDVKKGFTSFVEKDVLVAKITPCFENGKGALAEGLEQGVGFGSTEFHVIRSNAIQTCPEFIYQLTISYPFRAKGEMNMTGTAGQKRVSKSFIEKYTIAYPPLHEQRKIAEILNTVDTKIDLLKQQKVETQQLKKGLMQKLLTGEWRVPVEETEAA